MYLSIIGIIITLLGIAWTVIGIFSNRSIKKSILQEKDMIREKVIDFKSRLNVYQNKLAKDIKNKNDNTLDTLLIRIEDIDSMVNDLNRFSDKLK